MQITFFGAAGEVTGSKHVVSIGSSRILLDCGLYQGRRSESVERNKAFSFIPASLDAVVISHAHLDHVGMLPLLIRGGYTGRIYSTAATRDLTELILLDAAKIQEQDAEFHNRHLLPDAPLAVPLYTSEDIPNVMQHFETLPYASEDGSFHQIAHGCKVKLYDAGHILGSAVIVLEGNTQGKVERLAFTGDLGRYGAPLLHDPQPVTEEVQTLLLESTYGSRLHHPTDHVHGALIQAVQQAIARQSKIVVPAFSLGRTQELVYILHQLTDQGKIPRIPIYVDSPLAGRINDVFTKYQRLYDAESNQDFTQLGEDPLVFRNLRYTHSVEESKALLPSPGPMIIISASGMASGGRVMHHLRNYLPDPKNIILFTGYQADHTPGRRILKGAPFIRIFGDEIPVKAQIVVLNDLSAHADASELTQYAGHIAGLRSIFLVHGEPDRAEALATYLRQFRPSWTVTIPEPGKPYDG